MARLLIRSRRDYAIIQSKYHPADDEASKLIASEQGARQLHEGIQRVRNEGLGQMKSGVGSTLEEANLGKA